MTLRYIVGGKRGVEKAVGGEEKVDVVLDARESGGWLKVGVGEHVCNDACTGEKGRRHRIRGVSCLA